MTRHPRTSVERLYGKPHAPDRPDTWGSTNVVRTQPLIPKPTLRVSAGAISTYDTRAAGIT
jgi:hypothetical protein